MSSSGSSFVGFVLFFFAATHFLETGTLYMFVTLLDGWVYEVCGGRMKSINYYCLELLVSLLFFFGDDKDKFY